MGSVAKQRPLVPEVYSKDIEEAVKRDRELQEELAETGRELCALRWHWLANPDNPNRLVHTSNRGKAKKGEPNYSGYARRIGVSPQVIRKYCVAYEIMRSNKELMNDVVGALQMAEMSKARRELTAEVARTRKLKIADVRTDEDLAPIIDQVAKTSKSALEESKGEKLDKARQKAVETVTKRLSVKQDNEKRVERLRQEEANDKAKAEAAAKTVDSADPTDSDDGQSLEARKPEDWLNKTLEELVAINKQLETTKGFLSTVQGRFEHIEMYSDRLDELVGKVGKQVGEVIKANRRMGEAATAAIKRIKQTKKDNEI